MNHKERKTEIFVSFDVVLVSVPCGTCQADTVSTLFEALSRAEVNVDLISLIPPRRSAGGLSFSVFNRDFVKVLKTAAQLKHVQASMPMEVCSGYSKIVLRGAYFPQASGVAAAFFSALRAAGSEIALVATSDTTISTLVRSDELDKTIAALETAFPDAETVYPE